MPRRPDGLSRPRDGVHQWPVWDKVPGDLLEHVGSATLTVRTDKARHVVLEALRLAATIYLARTAKGWSKRTLAEHIGVSQQTLGNIEAGRTFPDFVTLVLLAERFKKDLVIHWKPPLPPARAATDPARVRNRWARGPEAEIQALHLAPDDD